MTGSAAVDDGFWGGKKVLVTGHTGFKGSWLSLWLQKLGADVVGYSLDPPSEPSLFEVADVADGMVSIIGDVRDFATLRELFARHRPEIVFHLAAQALVRRSYRDPIETYGSNVMGTVNLLEAVRRAGGVRAVVNVTSDKCYDNREWVWGYRENDRLGGHDPYSNSKACAELVSSAFRDSFFPAAEYERHGVALASARAGNVIGGGDWAEDRLIPDIMRAMVAGKPVSIRNPDAIRPWQHVLEPLAGYLTLAERLHRDGPEYAEAWKDRGTSRPAVGGGRPLGGGRGRASPRSALFETGLLEGPHAAGNPAPPRSSDGPGVDRRLEPGLAPGRGYARGDGAADRRVRLLALTRRILPAKRGVGHLPIWAR